MSHRSGPGRRARPAYGPVREERTPIRIVRFSPFGAPGLDPAYRTRGEQLAQWFEQSWFASWSAPPRRMNSISALIAGRWGDERRSFTDQYEAERGEINEYPSHAAS